MIEPLIECDDFEDVATLNNMRDLLNDWEDLSRKLRQIADKIVHKLVQWTKRLPFYAEIPLAVHTQVSTPFLTYPEEYLNNIVQCRTRYTTKSTGMIREEKKNSLGPSMSRCQDDAEW